MEDFHYLCELIRGTQAFLFLIKLVSSHHGLVELTTFYLKGLGMILLSAFPIMSFIFVYFQFSVIKNTFSFCQLNNQFVSSGNVTPTKHLLFDWRDFPVQVRCHMRKFLPRKVAISSFEPFCEVQCANSFLQSTKPFISSLYISFRKEQ